jgi:cytochrome c556
MQQQVNPAMMAIWDVGNNALDENGGLDASLLDDAKWATIADNADKLAAAGKQIGGASDFVAAAADNSTVGEGEIKMAAVQKHVDGNPDGLKQMGTAFADSATRLDTAARAKDVKTAGDLISGMDQVCESCHLEYWYPEQKELVEQANQ